MYPLFLVNIRFNLVIIIKDIKKYIGIYTALLNTAQMHIEFCCFMPLKVRKCNHFRNRWNSTGATFFDLLYIKDFLLRIVFPVYIA